MAEGGADKLNVFISYSRDDLDFADQLDHALRYAGFATTLDRHGISGGENWQKRLGLLIRDADTVVFVLSPSSAKSDICAWEVDEAVRLGKRVLPAVCRPLGDVAPPKALADLNYVFFYDEPKSPGSGFGLGLSKLGAALNTDLDWLQEHTRLLQRAIEWVEGGRPPSRLLSGADIVAAKAWAARRPKEAPAPTDQHLEFLKASEAYETEQHNERRRELEERERLLREAEAAQKREAEAQKAREAAQREASELARKEAEQAKRLAEQQTAMAEQARRVTRRTRIGLIAALVLAAVAGGAGWWAFTQQQVAEVNAQTAADAKADAENALLRLDEIIGRVQTRALTERNIGDELRKGGDQLAALEAYRTSLALRTDTMTGAPEAALEPIEQLYQRISDTLVAENRASEAVAVANDRIAYIESLAKAGRAKPEAVAKSLGNYTWYAVLAGDYAGAVQRGRAAVAILPDALWMRANFAHALMFSGAIAEAKAEYLAHMGQNVGKLKWEESIRSDFAFFRDAGLAHPLMAEIEMALR